MPVLFGDIYAADDLLGDPIDTFTDEDIELFEGRDAGNDIGAAQFILNRKNEHATAANLAWGNMVKFRVPTIQATPVHAIILAQSEDTLASEDEEGGEQIQRGGPSLLKLLSYARLPDRSYHGGSGFAAATISGGHWKWTDVHPAAIFRRLLAEDGALDDPALWMLDPTFTINTSSAPESASWPAFTGEFDFAAGDDFLSIYQALREAEDFDIWINPNTLDLNAYIDRGEDRSSATLAAGKVRFQSLPNSVENNILTTLDRSMEGEVRASHAWVGGKDNVWVLVERGSWSPGDPIRYIFIPYEKSRNTTTLTNAGIRALAKREKKQDAVELEIDPEDDELAGKYLPWLHFRPGTDVTLHTGATPAQHDYNNVTKTVTAIKLIMDEATSDEDEGDGVDSTKRRSLHVVVELDNENITDGGTRGPGGGPGSQNPPPVPPPVCEPAPGLTVIAEFHWTTNTNDDTNTYDSNISRDTSSNWVTNFGTGPIGELGNSGERTQAIPVVEGQTAQVTMRFRWKWGPSTRPIYVQFWTDNDPSGFVSQETVESGAGRAVDTIYELSWSGVVPATALFMTVTWPSFHGLSRVDDLVVGTIDAAPGNEDYCIVEEPGAPGVYAPWPLTPDMIGAAPVAHEHERLVVVMTNDSGGDLVAGAVVVASSTVAESFDTTASAAFVDGVIGVLLADCVDGEEGQVIFAGYVIALQTTAAPAVGDFLFTSTTPGEADADAARDVGAFGVVLDVEGIAILWGGDPDGSSGGGGHTIENSGTPLTARTGLNFLAPLVATDDAGGDETDISVDQAESGDISTQAFGDAAAAGASTTEVAMANHVHGMPANPVTTNQTRRALLFSFDAGADVLAVGSKAVLRVPFDCTIVRGSLMALQSGAAVVDFWVDTWANYPPADADSITASAPLTITATDDNSEDATLTGWDLSLARGDVIIANVDSATTIQQLMAELEVVAT